MFTQYEILSYKMVLHSFQRGNDLLSRSDGFIQSNVRTYSTIQPLITSSLRLKALWSAHTGASLGAVEPVAVLGLHRPITAQEELPAQWGEKPAQTVGEGLGLRLVGQAFGTAQQVTLGNGPTNQRSGVRRAL